MNWFTFTYILDNLITNSIHAWLTKDYRSSGMYMVVFVLTAKSPIMLQWKLWDQAVSLAMHGRCSLPFLRSVFGLKVWCVIELAWEPIEYTRPSSLSVCLIIAHPTSHTNAAANGLFTEDLQHSQNGILWFLAGGLWWSFVWTGFFDVWCWSRLVSEVEKLWCYFRACWWHFPGVCLQLCNGFYF